MSFSKLVFCPPDQVLMESTLPDGPWRLCPRSKRAPTSCVVRKRYIKLGKIVNQDEAKPLPAEPTKE